MSFTSNDLEIEKDKHQFVNDDPSFSSNDLRNDEDQNNDRNYIDTQPFGSSNLRPENHVPASLYDEINTNRIAQAFVGFYAADGFSYAKDSVTGIRLRSADFPFI